MKQNKAVDILLIGLGDISAFAQETARRYENSNVTFAKSAAIGLSNTNSDTVLVQPTFLLPGSEYEKMRLEAKAFSGNVIIGKPLLHSEQAITTLAEVLGSDESKKFLLFVGHGSAHAAGAIYHKLANALQMVHPNAFLCVLNGQPDFANSQRQLISRDIHSIHLVPLMMTSSKHVKEEIIGETDSIRSRLNASGVLATFSDLGLLEYPAIREMIFLNMGESLFE
jgi:sirohydrochlorin cobaltochelatase